MGGVCRKLITGFSLQTSFVSVFNYNPKLSADYLPYTERIIWTADLPGKNIT